MEIRYESSFPNSGWLFNGFNHLFEDFEPSFQTPIRPATDVMEDNESYRFYFDMPGLKNDSVDLRVEDHTLRVTAERKRPEWPKNAEVHLAERHYGPIRRSFELPKDADPEHVTASYKDGVLEVRIEKRAEARPVKIQIN
jgi:HSP20 family protein